MGYVRQRAAIRGRDSERARLVRLLESARAGHSAVLVLRGEAGIGKTALLDYLLEHAEGCRVARAVGVQSEMELAFAGLQQLCGPLLDGLDGLPAPQRDALDVAFGKTTGPAPDRFLVGLAVLGLLSEAAADRPVVCVIDDAQWLDRTSAQVLAFVARRLLAESVALVFAVREPSERHDLTGLPDLLLEGLGDAHARELLASVITGRLDEQVVDRIIAETRGNPLALLELPRGLCMDDLAGGFGVSAGAPLTPRIEESFLKRLRLLPAETQQLLLVAAAEPAGDPVLLWRAAEQIGLGVHAAAPAEAVGLLDLGATRVRFRHPLVRSAVYGAATLEDRQRAHRALAEAIDPRVDPDRRAWHRAQAALGPDEDVAGELERSADRAMARGGLAAAAAFLERAAALTPESGARARRALAAARAKEQAGAPQAALTLLSAVESWPLDELQRATIERLRGQIGVHLHRDRDAGSLLLKAARRLESLDIRLARETYLEALYAANVSGRLGNGLLEVAQAARAAPRLASPQPATDILLDGLAVRFTDGYLAGAPILKRALCALADQEVHGDQGVRWLSLALRTAADLFDEEMWRRLVNRQVQLAHDTGALSVMPLALVNLAHLRIFAGEFDAAKALMDEADAITDATGNARLANSLTFLLAAYQDELGATMLIQSELREASARGDGMFLTYLEYANAVLHNGLGLYDAAMGAARRASAPGHLSHSAWALPELVEAATRAGDGQVATAALQDLSARALASGTDWGSGVAARSAALLAEGRMADSLYREAIDRLSRCRVRVELARARLVYGEWLRRERRRVEAREQLRIAHEMFTGMGARAFAERARRELLATGERARRRAVDTTDSLTTQEQQVAHLARDGRSNQEIGGQLFISPKTVEYHLHKAFTKLGIRSRHQLDGALRRD